jgi:DNA-binding transcriptional MerR regulator
MRIPDNKRYFRIGEVSKIIGVEPYVLRYWENEFVQIRPSRADSKQRTYQKKDLEIIIEIKRLLYEEKMTIEGAKKKLASMREPASQSVDSRNLIKEIKNELQEILEQLG